MDPNDVKDNIRQVVIEPPKPPQSRLKQYVVLIENSNIKGLKGAKKFSVIRMASDDAIPYVSAHMLSPLDIAIKEGIYPPQKDTLVEKLKNATQETKDRPAAQTLQQSTTEKEGEKKSFLSNKLRDAIQQRKEESTESQSTPTVLPADKLAAIQSGGKPTPDEDKN